MWLPEQVAGSVKKKGETVKQQDVVLYGFGRIGRLLARILLERSSSLGANLRLRAVVVRKNTENDLEKRASLLARDSVHGPFKGTIKVDAENNTIIANGCRCVSSTRQIRPLWITPSTVLRMRFWSSNTGSLARCSGADPAP